MFALFSLVLFCFCLFRLFSLICFVCLSSFYLFRYASPPPPSPVVFFCLVGCFLSTAGSPSNAAVLPDQYGGLIGGNRPFFIPGYRCHSPVAPSDSDRLISGYRLAQTALFGDPCCTVCVGVVLRFVPFLGLFFFLDWFVLVLVALSAFCLDKYMLFSWLGSPCAPFSALACCYCCCCCC